MSLRGKNGFFEFNQVDFGIQFTPFMRDIATVQDPRWHAHHEALTETNRYCLRSQPILLSVVGLMTSLMP